MWSAPTRSDAEICLCTLSPCACHTFGGEVRGMQLSRRVARPRQVGGGGPHCCGRRRNRDWIMRPAPPSPWLSSALPVRRGDVLSDLTNEGGPPAGAGAVQGGAPGSAGGTHFRVRCGLSAGVHGRGRHRGPGRNGPAQVTAVTHRACCLHWQIAPPSQCGQNAAASLRTVLLLPIGTPRA